MAVKIKYYVHGTTTDNLNHKATGWLGGTLSNEGIENLVKLKNQVDYEKIDLVISSDLERAISSSKIVFEDKFQVLHDARIRECNYGDLNGLDSKLVKYEEHISIPFKNGESLLDVLDRVNDFCKYLLDNYDGKMVALVSHKAPQLALEVITKGITMEEAIEKDWRKTKSWKPGWDYLIDYSHVKIKT